MPYAVFSLRVLRFTFHMILHHRNIQLLFSVTVAATKFTCWAVFSFWILRLNTSICCLYFVNFEIYLSCDPSSKECPNTNFFLFHPDNVYMWAFFSFWVLRFTFDIILHHRNIQILFSVTATATKFTCCAVFSFSICSNTAVCCKK